MASGTTSNYQLSQWSASDQVRMADFNADNQKIDAALAAVPKLAYGSYVGDGGKGEAQKNTLTFDFPPKLLILTKDVAETLCSGVVLIRGQTHSDGIGANPSGRIFNLTVQWSGNTVSWHSNSQYDGAQLNDSGVTYYYFAIG